MRKRNATYESEPLLKVVAKTPCQVKCLPDFVRRGSGTAQKQGASRSAPTSTMPHREVLQPLQVIARSIGLDTHMSEPKMRLFDEVESLGDRAIFYNESDFDYVQGSGRAVMMRVRSLLESWFAEYPDGKKKETLRQDLRGEKSNRKRLKPSVREKSFNAAFFELYIYILLRRLGCEVVIEPPISHLEGKVTAPDFLATHKDTGYPFYVEATVQTNERAQKYDRFLSDVKAVLDQIRSPDYVICIDRLTITSKHWTASTNRLARHTQRLASDLQRNRCSRNLAPLPVQGQGWKLSLHFEPRAGQEEWVNPCQSLKETPSTRAAHSTENIRKAIEDKACHYGNLDQPFIIAINVLEHLVDPRTVFESVYGSISHVYNVVKNDSSPIGDLEFSHFERKPDGSFRARGRQNTRVSAIWIASGLLAPSGVGSAKLYEFENHFAQQKFVPPFPCLARRYIDDKGELSEVPGLTPQQILGLESHWPYDSPLPTLDFSKWSG